MYLGGPNALRYPSALVQSRTIYGAALFSRRAIEQQSECFYGLFETYQLTEVVFSKVLGWFIFINNFFHSWMLFNVALKQIERRVVTIEQGVL